MSASPEFIAYLHDRIATLKNSVNAIGLNDEYNLMYLKGELYATVQILAVLNADLEGKS
jgi:hypothetical protein